MGILPKLPLPPLRTLSKSCWLTSWPLYFAATSLKAGPTIFLSTEWQVVQEALFMAVCGSPARAGVATDPTSMAARMPGMKVLLFMSISPGSELGVNWW